ncbi:MAG: transposase [Acidobacteria bacterium]|nr:transposase [Acidobacteriota bacterium]
MKVLVYAYLRNIYSSRKIEQALQENVHFMWLAGNARPDHNTLADFRSKRLKDHLEKIFSRGAAACRRGAVSLREVILTGRRSRRTRTGTRSSGQRRWSGTSSG